MEYFLFKNQNLCLVHYFKKEMIHPIKYKTNQKIKIQLTMKLTITIISVLLCLNCFAQYDSLTPTETVNTKVDQYVNQIAEYFKNEKYEAAAKVADKAMSEGLYNEPFFVAKLTYLNRSKASDSEIIKVAKDGLKRIPTLAIASLTLIHKYSEGQDINTMYNNFKRLSTDFPETPDILCAFASCSEQIGNNVEARSAYKRCIKIQPDHYNANYYLAVNYYNEAAKHYKELNDDSYYACLRKAIPYFEKAYSLTREKSTANVLMNLYKRLGEDEKLAKLKAE